MGLASVGLEAEVPLYFVLLLHAMLGLDGLGLALSRSQVARLTRLLGTELNTTAVDERCKAAQSELFKEAYYRPAVQRLGAATGCQSLMAGILGPSYNATDAAKVARWLQAPCPFSGPLPPDPACAHGVKSAGMRTQICCLASCGVCAHPGAACRARPGGRDGCCPSDIQAKNASCSTHPAPCVMSAGPDE